MAFTYTVQDGIDLMKRIDKGLPSGTIDVRIADMVYGRIWIAWPWADTLAQIAAGSIPCSDGVQDYNPPQHAYRATKLSLVRTDVTPNQHRELHLSSNLSVDLVPRSYSAIRSAGMQPGAGQIRLESAIQVPTGTALEIQGEYQRVAPKITSLGQSLSPLLKDEELEVFTEGLLYWAYRLGDYDQKAGGIAFGEDGKRSYTGQYAKFMASIRDKAESEDFGASMDFFPSEAMGAGRDIGSAISIFGW